ncbi:cellulase family glycosylhydrolase [Methylobacterium sp. WL6]|uniref:glycoside hydrolase family 5 protein n=1 Tax=Methylobacterium sp. WL6 TaxID=2603901 RepID=UPI0011C7FB6A|nr:cellulase family glycosylhydrolase [Methylobacterium sp. WL6]TXN72284.1 glycoside hydrolase family 5 protein [Methylobacterium sp. WL6]
MTVRSAPGAGMPSRRSVVRTIGGFAAVAGIGFSGAVSASAPDGLGKLARGVNLSHWFAQSFEGYGAGHLKTFVTSDDLRLLSEAGFTHVRLGVEPDALFQSGDGEPQFVEPVLEALGRALDMIARAGLAVVVDMHPVGASKNPLQTPAGAATFVARWSKLAGAVAAHPIGAVLEILNEPEPLAGPAWWTLQARALEAIRSAGAKGPVIANGGGWSGIDDLVAHTPYDDGAVVYTVHCYAPLLFTHQGATWTWDVARSIAGLGWPLDRGQAEAASAATSDPRARGFLHDQIADGSFTASALEVQYDRLSHWARSHGDVPIYVGEFGVYAKTAPVAARIAWVRASRRAYEQRGWGWALWDDSDSFGFRSPGAGRGAIDAAMLDALGVGAS